MRFALIGFGTGGRDLARALRAADQELVGICDPSPARVDLGSREIAAAPAGSPELAAASFHCEAVAISLPSAERFAVVRAALRAGRHVLVDGHAAASPEELLELEALAAKAGLVLIQGPAVLHSASAQRLRSLSREPEAGSALGMRAWRARYRAPRRVRDLLEVIALPDLALFGMIAGAEPSAVSASAVRSGLTGQVDSISLSVWYPTGWPARLEISAAEPSPRGLAVLCQQRKLVLDASRPERQVLWIEEQPWADSSASARMRGLRRELEFADPASLLCRAFLRAAAGERRSIASTFLASALRVIRSAEQQIEAQNDAGSQAA